VYIDGTAPLRDAIEPMADVGSAVSILICSGGTGNTRSRAFAVIAGASAWNSLPHFITHRPSSATFKKRVKI